MKRVLVALAMSGLVVGSVPTYSGAQDAQTGTAAGIVLRVEGEVPHPLKWTAGDLAKLPRQLVKAKDHTGKDAEFEGVMLVEVLKQAGVKFGQDLKGPALAQYLVVEASDGYRAVFALPELDPASTDGIVLLADRRDGQALGVMEGPLRIVIPGEKRHTRWVRQVITLWIGRA